MQSLREGSVFVNGGKSAEDTAPIIHVECLRSFTA